MSVYENENVIEITGDLYVKTQEALDQLMEKLKSTGYKIKDLRKEKDGEAPIEMMEKNGWSLWYASLPNLQKGKCGSCKSIIKVGGICSHGHKCEVCGEVTYYDIIDGSTVEFRFNDDGYDGVMFSPKLKFNVKRWDAEESRLFLYPEPLEGRLSSVTGEKAKKYLEENKSKWQEVEENGQKLIQIKYARTGMIKDSDINMYEIMGHYHNHSIVKIWGGEEYSEWADLPINERMSIYETWHWAPLQPTPTLHEKILSSAGMVSDKGYYYQDGRAAFYAVHWQRMAKFIRHFTTLDADAFDAAWPRFNNSGPGAIDALARFCHKNPLVENKPNIGNALVLVGKLIEGQTPTNEEINEGCRGLKTKDGIDFFGNLLQ